ncbi:hypothetical protein [Endozoicomonas sp. 4G]|uniref:hypothetical protein n=1 Tax=Endozoicomonas sp. 4G TaxID=2872754 RepID=UPI002078E013|nr:hypothetical protein [Endozoicomonas sp. 4G]
MLSKKPLILILVMAFPMHCSNGHAQENRLPLLFALAVGKALFNTPKPFIEESEIIKWWELKQESEENDSDTLRVCFGDDILLKPDTRYCVFPATGVEAKAYGRATSDDSADSEDSGSEDSGTSDKNSDSHSSEVEADAESDVQYVSTTLSSFPVSNEISQYCAALALKKIKQEPVSGSEIPTYSTDHMDHSKTSKQTHLPAGQQPKMHRCDHEGCNHSSKRAADLRKHKQTHLPADQRLERPKVHHCDHEGCNFSTSYTGNLNKHKQTHFPADQRLKRKAYDQPPSNKKRKKGDKE